MLERISQLMTSKKLTASQFADEVGVQPSSVSHVMSGRNKPSLDFVTKIILAYPDIDPEWLLTGKGNMYGDGDVSREKPAAPKGGQTTMDLGDTRISGSGPGKDLTGKEEDMAPYYHSKAGITSGPGQQKRIDKIVFFFNDGTFRVYSPS